MLEVQAKKRHFLGSNEYNATNMIINVSLLGVCKYVSTGNGVEKIRSPIKERKRVSMPVCLFLCTFSTKRKTSIG